MTGTLPLYGVDDFAASFAGHMPTGAIWPREPDTVQGAVVRALVPTYVRNWQTAQALLVDAFPATAVYLLPEWEATLGLPDPCAGPDQTVAQRQAHVVARLVVTDGPSIAGLTAYAAQLDYAITIAEFAASRFGQGFGMAFGGEDWAHTFQINAPQFSVDYFKFGSNDFGDPWASWGNTVLFCELARIKPAQTLMTYGLATGLAALWDASAWDDGTVWT